MPDSVVIEKRTGAIAGIEIIHQLSPNIELGELPVAWPNGAATERPVAVTHSVGDVNVAGMRHIMDVGMRVSYFATDGGGTAIRIRNLEPGGPIHLVRVIESGADYAVRYEFAPRTPAYRRDVEIASYAHAITARGTHVMAHGCGLVLAQGVGAICLGSSGAGKSTAARMLDGRSGARVLNDDRLVIGPAPDGFHLWGTPWPGNAGVARPGDARLGVVALIGRGPTPGSRRLTTAEALARVLPTLALPIWEPELMATALGIVDTLLRTVPVVELRYPLDDSTGDWMVETLLNGMA